jgi:hypothetical protein
MLYAGVEQGSNTDRRETFRECEDLPSEAIVDWGSCAKLLDAGTCRGQVCEPVRQDRCSLDLAWRQAYGEFFSITSMRTLFPPSTFSLPAPAASAGTSLRDRGGRLV